MEELDTKYIALLVSIFIILILSFPYLVYVMNWLVGVN